IHKRDDKLIFIDENSCIGCRECVLACPFGAVRMAPVADGRVVATKCDLCVDTKAGTPACVKGCPKKALTLMNDETLKAWLLYKQEHSA
ncbi:4Fe-4S binding protein, partial [Veillonella sp.]